MNKLELLANSKVRPTLHVSLSKPFEKNTLWPDRKQVIRPPLHFVRVHLENKVEGIFKSRKPKQKIKQIWKGKIGNMMRLQ
jgi:hypothetical protein